jgi:acetyl esterase/lipase
MTSVLVTSSLPLGEDSMFRSLLLLVTLLPLYLLGEEKRPSFNVWPGKAPGEIAATGEKKDVTTGKEGKTGGKRVMRLTNVATPTLTVYAPPKDKDTGTAVVVCPGGGYSILAADLEGSEVCEWLNTLGITGILLEYRVPRPKKGPYYEPALMDAQRAISLVRSKAKSLGIQENRIGILGFSAGGHLSATTATNFDKRAYEAIDDVDKISCRPDFAVLIYPAYLTNKEKTALAEEIRVTKQTPPMFLVHTSDDPIPSDNSVQLYLALKREKVPCEMHIYEKGGHGYGLRPTDVAVTGWPAHCEKWFKGQGLLK